MALSDFVSAARDVLAILGAGFVAGVLLAIADYWAENRPPRWKQNTLWPKGRLRLW